MKSLLQYIIETRGVVTGEFDWSELVKVIIDTISGGKGIKYDIPTKDLPSWIDSLSIHIIPGGLPSYEYEQSSMVGDKLKIIICTPPGKESSWYYTALNHELQHAFDDWIAHTRRGKGAFDDKYCISTGYEDDDMSWGELYDLVTRPQQCTFDHIFNILKQSTYALHQSEVNAYLREFDIYMKGLETLGKNEWDFSDIVEHADNGMCPLVCLNCLSNLKSNINKLDVKDNDWPWVAGAVNSRWTKEFLGHQVNGTGKDVIIKIVDLLFKIYGNKISRRYSRILQDHNIVVKKQPEWFK